jgi:hypothetical protein
MIDRPGCCITEPFDCNENINTCVCTFSCGPKTKVCQCTCEDGATPAPGPAPTPQPKPTQQSRLSILATDDAGISIHGQPLRVAQFANYLRKTWKVDVHVSDEVAGVMLPTNWETTGTLEDVLDDLGKTAHIRIRAIKNGDTVAAVAIDKD